MSLPPKLPFHEINGFEEAVFAVVAGFGIWGYYRFPHFTIVALGFVTLGCVGAFMWKRSHP